MIETLTLLSDLFLLQGDFLSRLKDLTLSEEDEYVTKLEEIADEQHFEVRTLKL